MTSYTPLPPITAASYSPPLEASYRNSADLTSTELRQLESNYDGIPRSRAQSLQDGGGYDSYSYMSDVERKGLVSDPDPAVYQTYKRRWFGLAELVLLNFAIGWGYAAPGVVSTTATEWFGVSYETLNSLGIASSLAFLVPAPFVIWVLNKHGPKASIIVACTLTVLGNWIVYAATRAKSFPGNVVGTIIAAWASPFIQAAPTRYSRQWFGDRSRTIATALQALAYPLGAGFGALTGPMMVEPVGPMDYAGQALIIAIAFTAVSIPAPFIPKEPPTPPSAVAAAERFDVKSGLKALMKNKPFYLLFITFSVVAGSIDTLTATTNQGIVKYGYSQSEAGLVLAVLIAVGVLSAVIVSPILDKTKRHTLGLKIFMIAIALSFTALPFVPQTQSVPALFIIFGLVGASVLSIEPCVLEVQASWTHPVSPELSSFICWGGAKVLAAVFTLLVGSVLVLDEPKFGQPKGSLFVGQIFIAAMAWLCVPCTILLGYWIFKKPAASQVHGNE